MANTNSNFAELISAYVFSACYKSPLNLGICFPLTISTCSLLPSSSFFMPAMHSRHRLSHGNSPFLPAIATSHSMSLIRFFANYICLLAYSAMSIASAMPSWSFLHLADALRSAAGNNLRQTSILVFLSFVTLYSFFHFCGVTSSKGMP